MAYNRSLQPRRVARCGPVRIGFFCRQSVIIDFSGADRELEIDQCEYRLANAVGRYAGNEVDAEESVAVALFGGGIQLVEALVRQRLRALKHGDTTAMAVKQKMRRGDNLNTTNPSSSRHAVVPHAIGRNWSASGRHVIAMRPGKLRS